MRIALIVLLHYQPMILAFGLPYRWACSHQGEPSIQSSRALSSAQLHIRAFQQLCTFERKHIIHTTYRNQQGDKIQAQIETIASHIKREDRYGRFLDRDLKV